MSQQQSLQQKQNYLRENIIEKGYDPQQFVTFCIDKYGQVDLQIWNLNKLKDIVQSFINKIHNLNIDKQQSIQKQSIKHQLKINQQKQLQQFKKINQKQSPNQDQQWNEFQSANNHIKIQQQPKRKISQQKPKNVVFSQADWDMFLMGPTNNINTHTNNNNNLQKKPISDNSMANYQFQFFGMIPQPKKQQNKDKNVPIEVKNQSNKKQSKSKNTLPINPVDQSNLSFKQQQGSGSKSQKKQTKQEKSKIKASSIQVIPLQSYKDKKIKIKVQKTKQVSPMPNVNDIQIIQTQQVSRNFLQGDYTLYHIQFRPTQHIIKRKFADFRKLRSLLQKLYPTVRLPYIQPQGWLLNTSEGKDTDALTRYKWMIVQFLKYITLQNTELKNSPLVRQFIGMTSKRDIYDKDYIKKMFQQYTNMNKLKYINDLTLLDNQIQFEFNPDYQKQIKNHQNIIPQIQSLYQKLKKQLELMFYNYDLLTKSMADLNSTFQTLQNTIKKFNYDNDSSKQVRVYQGLREMGIKLQNTVGQQAILFKNRIYNMIRYEKQNLWTIKEVLQTRNKINAQFVKQGNPPNPIIQHQNKLLQFSATLALDQPVKNNKIYLSMQNTFWEHVTITQIEKYWKNVRGKVCQQLTSISYDQLDTENDNLNFWNTMIKKCVI